jgi:outer membrane protein OmpA-like peptidoglycan-associated protein
MSVLPPDDIDVLDLDDLDRGGPGPVRRPRRPSPPPEPRPSGPSWTDPRFLVPLFLFLSAVFVIGMAVRSGNQTDDGANGQEIQVQSELALAVRDAELRAGFDDLTITEDDGSVIIEGQARDPLAAASIGAVARSVEGTQRVDNRVVVLGGAVESATQASVAPASTGSLDQQLANVGQVTFETGSADLTPGGSAIIDSVASLLNQSPGTRAEVHGHTDSDGDATRNEVLSQDRAEAVVVALAQRGIDAARLTAVGFGESKPLEPNITKEGRAVNRRIEFLIVG